MDKTFCTDKIKVKFLYKKLQKVGKQLVDSLISSMKI